MMKKILLSTIFLFSINICYASGTLILKPENPGPYEKVNVSFKTYSFDADNALFTWTINGKVVLSGKGEKSIDTQIKGIGTETKLSVKVESFGGEIVNSSLSLRPQSVDLVWESKESYTPPFYEGKSLPGENAEIFITALPSFSYQGKLIDAKNLSYAWFLNDEFIENGSGRGKQTVKIRLDYLSNENEIKVIARSDDGSTSEKRITIYPNSIKPIFYLKDPVLGIDYAHAIEKRFETTKEFTIALVPFFLSSKNNLNDFIEYEWSLNGLPITPTSNDSITLKPKENSYGAKKLSISINNSKRLLQKIEDELEIVFDTR